MKLLSLTIGGQQIQAPLDVPTGGLEPGGTGEKIIQNGIQGLLAIAVILALFFLIWGGIKWITSEGDKSKLDSARKTIIFSIIGLVLALLSFFIINLVMGLFGVPQFGK